MNYRILLKILGLLILLLAGSLLICEIYAFTVERNDPNVAHDFALLKTFFIAAALGGIFFCSAVAQATKSCERKPSRSSGSAG